MLWSQKVQFELKMTWGVSKVKWYESSHTRNKVAACGSTLTQNIRRRNLPFLPLNEERKKKKK